MERRGRFTRGEASWRKRGGKEGRKTGRLAVFISTRTGGGKEDEKRMRREDEEEPKEGRFGGKLI